jgi:hypothetical protein
VHKTWVGETSLQVGFWSFLNQWWNLPFLILLGLCGAFVLLQLVGLLGSGTQPEAHADADVDLQGHDLHGHALQGHGDVHDHDLAHTHVDHGGELSVWQSAMAFLGVGRVPFMVVWMTFSLCMGFAGIFANRVLFVVGGGYHALWFPLVLIGAFAAGVAGARLGGRWLGNFVDVGGPGATKKHQLTGKLGVVASALCDERFGEIRVQDDGGNELLVHARLSPGEAALPRSTRVVLVDFDSEREIFSVIACSELDDRTRNS